MLGETSDNNYLFQFCLSMKMCHLYLQVQYLTRVAEGVFFTHFIPHRQRPVFFFSFLLVHHFSDSEWTVIHHNGRQAEGKWGLTCVCVYMHVCVCVWMVRKGKSARTIVPVIFHSISNRETSLCLFPPCADPPPHYITLTTLSFFLNPTRCPPYWTRYREAYRLSWWERSKFKTGLGTASNARPWWTSGCWKRWPSTRTSAVSCRPTAPFCTCSAKMDCTKWALDTVALSGYVTRTAACLQCLVKLYLHINLVLRFFQINRMFLYGLKRYSLNFGVQWFTQLSDVCNKEQSVAKSMYIIRPLQI